MLWLSRAAHEYFGSESGETGAGKPKGFFADYDTPAKRIIGLLQWLDQSGGKEKVMRKRGFRSQDVLPAFKLAKLSRQHGMSGTGTGG